MKLRTKLLLGVGILLFAMVVVIYILPTVFIEKDVVIAANEIHLLLVEDQQQLLRSQQIWLENTLSYIKQNTDAQLYMLAEEGSKISPLLFEKGHSESEVWNALAQIASYDPMIGFLQSHNLQQNKAAVIMPHAATLYTIDTFSQKNGYASITLHDPKETIKERGYRALRLPDPFQKDKDCQLFILVEAAKTTEEMDAMYQELLNTALSSDFEKAEGKRVRVNPSQTKNEGVLWGVKIDMIRALTPFFVHSLSQPAFLPAGLVRLDAAHTGYAILTNEIFFSKPLFEDEYYYKSHPPLGNTFSASGSAIITVQQGDYTYIGNTLFKGENYLTVATTLGILPQQLALSSNKMILMEVSHNFWIGFDGKGHKLSQRKMESISQLLDSSKEKNGIINIEKIPFSYALIATLENNSLQFFELQPLASEKTIFNTLASLENKLTNRISVQLLLISVVTMILVLLFIGRIGYTVIGPVTKLADATQFVMAGRYGDVHLPDVGRRQDEIAILSRSFGDMVKGLEEREKIRGVLDKVVSKDVADEILKTQIHLGGEDRIVMMLFSDIRGFSQITAQYSPQKTISMLNACMTKISRVIEGEGGVIDKYVGDEVMAIFGAPTTHPKHALRAISTGILIIETLKAWNQQRTSEKEEPLEMGIGIHTGLVVAGNMGSEDRLNYTVLGSNVNFAERLCEIAKPNQLIISEATLSEPDIADSFYVKKLDPLTVKGFKDPVIIYEVTGFKWDKT